METLPLARFAPPEGLGGSVGLDSTFAGSRAYYSIADAATLMGVSRVSVWRWIRSGRLPATRLGHRTVRISHEAIERLAGPTRSSGVTHVHVMETPSRFDWTQMSATDHFVQFYESDDFLTDAVADFMAGGLRAGDAGIVIATPEHRLGLERSMAALGVDATASCASGQLVVLDAATTLAQFMVAGTPDPERFASAVGSIVARMSAAGRRVRAFGEMVALLVDAGKPAAAIRLEQLWNDLGKRHAFSLFCGYAMNGLRGEDRTQFMQDVCAEHAHVIPAESYTAVADPGDRLRMVSVLQQKAWTLEAEVAERKRAQAHLQVALAAERGARAEVEAALRLRDEFLSVAAHELKTPLTTLLGNTQLAIRRLERTGHLAPEAMTETLRVIAGQGSKLSRLLTQLLDVSRLDADKLTIEREPADLVGLVEQAVAMVRPSSERHVVTTAFPETEIVAMVDPLRLEQVLVNLLDNARRYSPDGGAIHVALTQSSSNASGGGATGAVELSVRDHGLGITPDKRDQLFQRYYQAHSTDYSSGWGLGLSISREIVERHGGTIRAEFPPDGGSCFVVRLPLA